jgi:2-polyprenyl-3-methyl-5-hydroxy-6-metoxy-1,4-benzoquinol methylase
MVHPARQKRGGRWNGPALSRKNEGIHARHASVSEYGSTDRSTQITKVVRNYEIVTPIPEGNYKFGGDSIGFKEIVRHIPEDKARRITLLDIGFGLGTLGEIVKNNDETRHWEIDGIDGYLTACRNKALFEKKYYRNIWHGLASNIPQSQLKTYDIICLFDVIEHLDARMQRSFCGAFSSHCQNTASWP